MTDVHQPTRVYRPNGKVAHLLAAGASNDYYERALCGARPHWDQWFGTGAQDEYELAAAMPLCQKCAPPPRLCERCAEQL